MSHVEHSILKETRLYLEKIAGDFFPLKKSFTALAVAKDPLSLKVETIAFSMKKV